MRAANYQRGQWLLLSLALLFGRFSWAQRTDIPLNDLAFVLGGGSAATGQYSSRTTVLDSLLALAFNQRHVLRVLLHTLSEENSPYQNNAREK